MEFVSPIATMLPKATGISRPHGSSIVSRPHLVRSINHSFPLTFIVRADAYPVAGGNWTQLTICLANLDRLAPAPAGLWVLSMANCDDKAMDTLGTLWNSNGRYSSHLVPFNRSSLVLFSLRHHSLEVRLH